MLGAWRLVLVLVFGGTSGGRLPMPHNNENRVIPAYVFLLKTSLDKFGEGVAGGRYGVGGWEAPLEEELQMKELITGEHLSSSKEPNGSNSTYPQSRLISGEVWVCWGLTGEGPSREPSISQS